MFGRVVFGLQISYACFEKVGLKSRRTILKAGWEIHKQNGYGGQTCRLNILLTLDIMNIRVFQRLGNLIDHLVPQNRYEHVYGLLGLMG